MSVYFLVAAFFLQVLFAQAQNIAPGSSEGDQLLITGEEYCSFLKQVASSDPHHLYDEKMATDAASVCIFRDGQPGHYSYSILSKSEKTPVPFLSKNNFIIYQNFLEQKRKLHADSYSENAATSNNLEENDPELKSNTIYFLEENFATQRSSKPFKRIFIRDVRGVAELLTALAMSCAVIEGTRSCCGDLSRAEETQGRTTFSHDVVEINDGDDSNTETILSKRKKISEFKYPQNTNIYSFIKNPISTLGYSSSNPIRGGGSGIAYDLTDLELNRNLVLKIITREKLTALPLTLPNNGELAIAAAPEMLPNVVKIEALIFYAQTKTNRTLPHVAKLGALTSNNNEQKMLLYVPKEAAENFQWQLGKKEFPYQHIAIVAQIMEKAPGRRLYSLLHTTWKDDFRARLECLNRIIPQIFDYLQVAFKKNFLHGDISSSNLMYDATNEKLTIIDLELSTKLDSYWEFSQNHYQSNHDYKTSMTLTRKLGTVSFMAPAVRRNQPHAAEIDAYSFGKILLQVIAPTTNDTLHQQTEIDSTDEYLDSLKNEFATNAAYLETQKENKFSDSEDVFTFFENNKYCSEKKFIDALLNLGCASPCYSNSKNPEDWRNTMHQAWEQVESAYEEFHENLERDF